MRTQYVSFQEYEHGSIRSVSSDLIISGKNIFVREGFEDAKQKKTKKRGMGIDCILQPDYQEYDKKDLEKQRKDIGCLLYDPNFPYNYQFSPLFAKYPFGQDYKNIGEDKNNYLDYPSYIDDFTRVEYSYTPSSTS